MAGESRACDHLAPVHGWFTEGFGSVDLKQAKELLGGSCDEGIRIYRERQGQELALVTLPAKRIQCSMERVRL